MALSTLLKQRFLRFRQEAIVLAYAIRHRETPFHLKLASLLLLIYLLSPFDLIPIMVPFIGLLDDLIIVTWGSGQLVKRLPQAVRDSSTLKAEQFIQRYIKRPLLFLAAVLLVIVLFWAGIIALVWYLI